MAKKAVCHKCGGPLDTSGYRCSKCREYEKLRMRQVRAERKKLGLCVCGNPLADDGRKMCPDCHLHYREKGLRAFRITHHLCTRCGNPIDTDGTTCSKCREESRNYQRDHAEHYRQWHDLHRGHAKVHDKERYRALKIQVLAHYGEKCSCCGEDQIEFLCLDHINGGGTQHRRELNAYGNSFYRKLVKEGYPPGYQVLCHNCNQSLGLYGYCPHQKK
jgi:predicted nucleic acid-binding Zn ribbon protein